MTDMTKTIKINSTRFGEIEIPEDKTINFPGGVLGFEELHSFVMLDHDEKGLFKWIQAVDNPDVAFLLTDPYTFKADYLLPEKALPVASIELTNVNDMTVLVMVSIPADNPTHFTLNLKGPVVFNHTKMAAVQYVIDSDDYVCDFKVETAGEDKETAKQG